VTGQDYINKKFLDALFAACESTYNHWFLRVVLPEKPGGKDYDLTKAIVTFAPDLREVVLHAGVETVHVYLDNWLELQAPGEGRVLYAKTDVGYEFVRKG
jgi:hypothetical protein